MSTTTYNGAAAGISAVTVGGGVGVDSGGVVTTVGHRTPVVGTSRLH
jgi:hypothetical protein